jgi:hypothetical protein
VTTEIPAALGLSPHDIAAVLESAGRAPSVHNTQPWAFRVAPDVIELHVDPARRLPAADPDDRELRLACGAALFTLRLALRGHDVRPHVVRFPDRDRPGLVAEVRRGGAAAPNPEITRLLAAVTRRRTDRHPFTDLPVDPSEQHALCHAATEEAAQLHIVRDGDQRRRLSRLAHIAHRRQLADPAFRAELARWTGTQGDRADGVPSSAGGHLPEPHDTWVLRDFSGGTARDRPPGKDFEEDPMIAVLTSHVPGAAGDVRAGEALQRVLLTATADGLAVSFLSQLVEVPDVRDQVCRLLGTHRPPHAVLRIGHGWPTPGTPRRAVADVIRIPETPPSR